jgi:glycosyltransferase involved in cell wall biosynthesis
MKIAIMGIRGIPARYGGFETLAEELGSRLVERGHEVAVYGRPNVSDYDNDYYKGIKRIILPTINHKYFDTVVHTFLCVLHSFLKKFDIILICNAANSIFSFIPRLSGKKVVVNVDGIERKRKKWNWVGKSWYFFGELFSVLFPNKIISDAKVIQEYYKKRYGKTSILIPYGIHSEEIRTKEILDKYGLHPQEYILYVSRLEPENNAHIVIRAFEKVKTEMNLVIVGDAPYAKEYINSLKETKDPRIIFTGYVFGQGYKEFQSHAFCYIHATEVGGTHPALIEAMGFGNCVIANGTPENREVLSNTGLIYEINDVENLKEKIQFIVDNPEIIDEYGKKSRDRAEKEYNWNSIVDKYEKLFKRITDRKKRRSEDHGDKKR